MGWVTLSLRKMEDKVLVNNLELELIQLSRRRMQFLRQQNKETTSLNRERNQALKSFKSASGYDGAREQVQSVLEALSLFDNPDNLDENGAIKQYFDGENGEQANATNNDGAIDSSKSSNYSGMTKDQVTSLFNSLNFNLGTITENLTETRADINNIYDQLCAQVEEETNEGENQFDMEQTEIETQLEATRAELEAVGQQISSDIKSTTIKLG